MPSENAHRLTVSGQVTDLFGHRFALSTPDGKILADLGPKGLEEVALAVGDKVTVTGEQKPSEIKVHEITRDGRTLKLPHGHEKHGGKPDGDAERTALAAVKAAGFEPVGTPRRKPKHFEIDGRRGPDLVELHVELDGHIRKTKPAVERRP